LEDVNEGKISCGNTVIHFARKAVNFLTDRNQGPHRQSAVLEALSPVVIGYRPSTPWGRQLAYVAEIAWDNYYHLNVLGLSYLQMSTSRLFTYGTVHSIIGSAEEPKMTIRGWFWSLACRTLVALGGWVVLWFHSPNLAAIVSEVAGLYLVAYWHENPKAQPANQDFTLEFKRRLALVEADPRRPFAI